MKTAIGAVIEHLRNNEAETIYSRHLTDNEGARQLLAVFGFKDLEEPYNDEDGFRFQNVILSFGVDTNE